MLLSIKLQPEAEDDILRNMLWWATNHSTDEALEWHLVVQRQISQISSNPESYPLSHENGDFPYEIRDALIGKGKRGSYRAVFTVNDDTIIVLRVLRASQGQIRPVDVRHPSN